MRKYLVRSVVQITSVRIFVFIISVVVSISASKLILDIKKKNLAQILLEGKNFLKTKPVQGRSNSNLKGFNGFIYRFYRFTERVIENAGLKSIFPYLKAIYIWILCVVCGAITAMAVMSLIPSIVSTAVLGIVGAGVPYVMLDILCRYNTDRIRDKLPDFISILSRWCGVREDVLYAMDKAVESGIGEPIRTYVRDTCLRVKSGMNIEEALDILIDKTDNTLFKDLIINLRQTIKSRGDVKGLLYRMESQHYRIKAEMDRRRISTLKDRLLVYIMMAFVPLVSGWFLSANKTVTDFYLDNSAGRAVLTVLTIIYAFGILLSIKMTNNEVK